MKCYYCESQEATMTIDDLDFCKECGEYIKSLKSDKNVQKN